MKVDKLKAKMTERRMTQRDAAILLNRSKNTINNKVNGIIEFDLDEAKQLGAALCMSDEEMIDIFLDVKS